jgi:hypothetical protein
MLRRRSGHPSVTGASTSRVAQAVAIIAKGEAANGRRYLERFMKPGELRAYLRNPSKGSRFLGHALHRATYARLRALFGRRFRYNPTNGPDFLDTKTERYIELTTHRQLQQHIRRYRNFQHPIDFIPEDLPRFQ